MSKIAPPHKLAPPPLKYKPPGINSKLQKKAAPMSHELPKEIAWGEVKRGEFPHMEATVCCDAGCRIHDIIVIFPALRFGLDKELIGHSFVHASCLRAFMEKVPQEMTVVKEHVASIVESFIVE